VRGSVLAIGSFRWLWLGSLCSHLCQWIQHATLGWVVYDITGSGSLLGAVLGSRAIPIVLLAPFAGVAADRYNRRALLLTSQLLAAVASLVFGAALALGALETWHLFAFMLSAGLSNILDRPARMTTVLDVVPHQLAMQAVAINTFSFSIARVVGPAMAGYLLVWFGAPGSFMIQGGIYLAAGAMVLLVSFPPHQHAHHKASAWKDLVDGFRHAATDRTARMLLTLGIVGFFLMGPTSGAILPALAKDVFHSGPEGLGIMLTALGVGGIAGGIAASLMGRADRHGLIHAASIAALAIGLVGLGASPSTPWALLFLALAGAAEMTLVTTNQIMLQMSAPDAMRGRMAGLTQLFPGVIALGTLLSGVLTDLAGPRGASAICGGVALAIIGAMWLGSPFLREMRLSDARRARDEEDHRSKSSHRAG